MEPFVFFLRHTRIIIILFLLPRSVTLHRLFNLHQRALAVSKCINTPMPTIRTKLLTIPVSRISISLRNLAGFL